MQNSVLEKSSQEGLWWWWQWYGWWWHGHGCCRSSCCYWPCQGSGQVQLWRFWRWLWRLLNSSTHCTDLVTENGHKELQGTKFAVMSGQFLQAKVLIGCPCAVLTGCIYPKFHLHHSGAFLSTEKRLPRPDCSGVVPVKQAALWTFTTNVVVRQETCVHVDTSRIGSTRISSTWCRNFFFVSEWNTWAFKWVYYF